MGRPLRAVASLASALIVAALAMPAAAAAHAGLIGKQDLPIPVWLFIWGAAIVLIVSFVVLAVAWREPKLQDGRTTPAPGWLSKALVNPVTDFLAGLFGVALLVLVVYSGLDGIQIANTNFSWTFVFVTFFLGGVALSVIFGDIFTALSPWRAIGRAFGGVVKLVSGQSAPAPLAYPERLGHWPAVAGLVAFGWFELIYSAGTVVSPEDVAIASLIYTAITLVCMTLFGVDAWHERGETFSSYFGMFARLSPVEVTDGQLRFRKPLTGAPSWGQVPGSLALVLVSIAITSFDGSQDGLLKGLIETVFDLWRDLGASNPLAFRLTDSVILALVIAVVYGLVRLGLWGMHTVRGAPSMSELGRLFAHTFIPIALAYLIAHYFTYFIYLEQGQFTYLLSDPLGDGTTDIFGTAGGTIDYSLISANGVWYVQVAALVGGHVTALALAHDKAISIWKDPVLATRSQYWMLAVMVGFTTLGLGLLSSANT